MILKLSYWVDSMDIKELGMNDGEIREAFAELCHSQWSGWMDYLFSKGEMTEDGRWIMPAWAVERWGDRWRRPTLSCHLMKRRMIAKRRISLLSLSYLFFEKALRSFFLGFLGVFMTLFMTV